MALFHATMNLPEAAAHCGMTQKELKMTFFEYLKYNEPNFEVTEDTSSLPRGKSRALANLFRFLPDLSQATEYREPFLGGGSVALEVTKRYPKLNIWVNDLYEPLTNFWKTLQDDGYKMYKRLQELKSRYPDQGSAKGLFLEAKELVNDDTVSPLYRACAFYVINKCSFSGLSESSSLLKTSSESNFSMRGIEKLPGYTQLIQNWKITNGRYQQAPHRRQIHLHISRSPL